MTPRPADGLTGFSLEEYVRMIARHEEEVARHTFERKVMIARACEFYSVRDVAEALNMSPGSVWRITDDLARGISRTGRPGPKRGAVSWRSSRSTPTCAPPAGDPPRSR